MSNNDICYEITFLHQVIIRLDFLEYVETDKLYSDETLVAILKSFPKRGKGQLIRFNAVNIVLDPNQPNASGEVIDGIQYDFADDKGNKLILSNKFLICEINKYETYEIIMDKLNPVLVSIFKKNKVTVLRTGIRYINLFDSEKIKLQKNYFINSIASSLETKLPINIGGVECIRSMHMSEYIVDGMTLNFRYGMFNPEYPKTMRHNNFSLDYDCFYEDPITGCDSIVRYLNQGHDAIQALFENSITDNLRKVLNNG